MEMVSCGHKQAVSPLAVNRAGCESMVYIESKLSDVDSRQFPSCLSIDMLAVPEYPSDRVYPRRRSWLRMSPSWLVYGRCTC